MNPAVDDAALNNLKSGEFDMRPSLAILTLGAAVIAAAPGAAAAQGFGIFEHGTCTMGRAGAGSAAPCLDGSAIFFNPAGIAGMEGWTASLGATLIVTAGTFIPDDPLVQNSDLNTPPIPVPHAFVVYGITDRVTAGLGIFAPYGLATEWLTTFEGRFVGYDNELQSIYIQPTLAYKIHERVSIGVGLDVAIGLIEINQRLDFAQQPAPAPAPPGTTLGQLGIPPQTDFAQVKLRATYATGVAGNFGVHVKVTDRISVAGRYLTRVTLDYDGTATFESVSTGIMLPAGNPFGVPGGTPLDAVIAGLNLFSTGAPLGNGDVSTSITMPDQLLAGIAVTVTPQLLLLADWHWVNWSLFDQIELDFATAATPDATLLEDYDDTNGIHVGFDWTANDRWSFRGGYWYNEAAAPDQTVTPLLPEGSRNQFSAGIGFQLTSKLRADVAYQFLKQNDRRGRVRERLPGETAAAVNSGLYESQAHLIGTTFTLHF